MQIVPAADDSNMLLRAAVIYRTLNDPFKKRFLCIRLTNIQNADVTR